ncbi:5-bromo-4-chloroindolyl phosphate hydrolysis family protein [Aquibacillus koreensis]|uniref:5-bromo-4-chloroindolyl phosphate hydrolysis family protein n=1 Tax=Aquibacillus koreensis TaxID=279446 RepID=A0A9X4AH91_9BACI|nr:5-bromo-4-chloroindolyl phosphate hydrolysis family protein [Aquibacillus koreensis]MCT2536442.1 5-bromo-4-chloroindolyl phosphate hydrolysis family protein [Aquibacillus koreensis]MDC3419469.1 5-bromo-4-chloroindolyl phosphate hydrolysis family protein [Aquibacillus koreensis]
MYKFLTVVVRIMIAIPVKSTIWLVSFFAYDLPYWHASAIALLGAGLTYGLLSASIYFRTLKKNQLKMREYRYIRKNLEEANRKIRRMQKALFSIRQFAFLKEVFDMLRTVRKIYQVTKKEPKRFYQGEKFYFSHLDSAVELTEKYVLLSSQPKKNSEMEKALSETRHTIKEMKTTIENDLYHILSGDLEQLHFELDYAKHTTNPHK